MRTPSAALSWELWRRHRTRIMAVIALVLGFALFYPALCAMAGFNLDSPDVLGEIAKKYPIGSPGMSGGLRGFRVVFLMFLVCGPAVTMVISLLIVVRMFTFTEPNPGTKDPMTFPARLFTLPVSTPFLFGWLVLAGMASVVALTASWSLGVRMPHAEIFAAYRNPLGWLALLALTQGVVWSLAAWPKTRTVIWIGLFGFIVTPAWRDVLESPPFLTLVLLLGWALACSGLQKMRHGQWQAWTWPWPFGSRFARAEMRGPPRFASPAQAQLWFEWRRFARPLCFIVAALALTPVTLHLLARVIGRLGPLQPETLADFVFCLAALPVLLHFCFAMAPPRADLPFLMNRPLTNGAMTMASLQAAGISTAFSWGLVLVAWCGMPLLGDLRAALRLAPDPRFLTIIVIALVLQTWRAIPVNLGFKLSGKRRLAATPGWMLLALYLGGAALIWFSQVDGYWNAFWRLVPALLMGLIALKFSLAFLAFRLCLKRRLLAPSALRRYLIFWFLLVAGLMAALALLWPPSQEGILPASLAVVLLVPLARIGFCPIALAWNRHA